MADSGTFARSWVDVRRGAKGDVLGRRRDRREWPRTLFWRGSSARRPWATCIRVNILEIKTADDIEAAMATLTGQTDALYMYSEPLTNANKSKIIEAVTAAKIPTIFGFREFVDAGGLIS
jgi:hypothetical protein